jgi:hypothetical protein
MSDQPKRGINCEGLDEAFQAEETRKSNLILEARLLSARQQTDEAAVKFAQAAEMEERLGEVCEAKGLIEKAWVHRFSAVRCWALAGNLHDAIALGDVILARPDLPERLRRRIQEYTQDLRLRRAQWSAGLALAGAAAEG